MTRLERPVLRLDRRWPPEQARCQVCEGLRRLYVTELQPELMEINSGVQGVPPFLARYTVDTHHTPGYVANQVQPRLFMTIHMNFDPFLHRAPTRD